MNKVAPGWGGVVWVLLRAGIPGRSQAGYTACTVWADAQTRRRADAQGAWGRAQLGAVRGVAYVATGRPGGRTDHTRRVCLRTTTSQGRPRLRGATTMGHRCWWVGWLVPPSQRATAQHGAKGGCGCGCGLSSLRAEQFAAATRTAHAANGGGRAHTQGRVFAPWGQALAPCLCVWGGGGRHHPSLFSPCRRAHGKTYRQP